MIVVIADDITGAAEMGGIALRYGLKSIIADDVIADVKADVLIIYTNTRSLRKVEAVEVMANLTKKVAQLNPSLFYKKTDSVLRGHILAEMKAQMKALNFAKGLLVPVNPSLGRIIGNGKYYVTGELIHKTSFANDPEFPIKSSSVLEMLGDEETSTKVVEQNTSLPENGISIGEAKNNEDVSLWATKVDERTLAAGGASFFNALLSMKHHLKNENKKAVELSSPLLLISGTTFQKNVQRIKDYSQLVSYMPQSIFNEQEVHDSKFEQWQNDILNKLSKHNKAIIAVDNSTNQKTDSNLLREKKARITERILKKVKLEEILIEGGSTAYSIIQKIGWQSFAPTEELQQGIVRMQVEGANDLHLTIKPGSYDWPPEWNFN
jgi:D-threonate/D-erythronate kinase